MGTKNELSISSLLSRAEEIFVDILAESDEPAPISDAVPVSQPSWPDVTVFRVSGDCLSDTGQLVSSRSGTSRHTTQSRETTQRETTR
ncbi:hypothetical protein RRG08_017175 [Elysia crispata]|uniref:Uncharacterized protein n=1 Tax=Elysia crispata TaxID=231223 RepID=A0AAE1B229_9GAST|nr:hypothetical protein RRG08_017175 [Elysia crispata]